LNLCSAKWARGSRHCVQQFSLLCALLLTASRLGAQQAQPDTYAGFDGQPVTDVEIAAAPTVDENAMRQLIQQKAGQAFSSDAIRKSTAALQQTRMFTAAEANVMPEQNGLRVLFVLEPTDYVGVVNFVGTGPNILYTGLLQAANVTEQSPFYSALETDATAGVVTYLRNLGYFGVEVRSETQRDDQHHIVNLTFYCTLGQQARIRNIEFTGLSPEQSDDIRRSLRGVWARLKRASLKSGQKYSERQATKSIAFIRDRLRTQKQLAPSIRLASVRYEPDTNHVDVTFDVKPGVRADVQVNGAHVSQRRIRRLVPIYEEGSVDQDLVDEGKANLAAYFQAKDYFNATVTSHMDQQDDMASIVYEVDRGARHRVKSVSFEGNKHFSTKQLEPQVLIKKGFLFLHGKYSEQLLKKSVTSLTQAYKNDGFSEVSVQPDIKERGSAIAVAFRIEEGAQDKVASVTLTGNKTQSQADLALASSRLSVGGLANLNMIGTLANPVLLGRVSLTSGEIFYLGKRFELQNGTIAFADPTHTNPVLNLFVNTSIEQYNLTLKLTGPVDRLKTSYTSDPSLSQVDIIHLLAFGNTNAEADSAPASSEASGAESVLASGVTSQLTGKFQSLTGLSQLTIDPLATNTQGDPGAQVAIQQRVTGSILFTYSTNVNETQDQTASLKYDFNKRLSVTILRDQNGGYGVGVRVHKVF
jgi:outer membrane protein assembly factor BamA